MFPLNNAGFFKPQGGSCPSYTPGLYTAEQIDTLVFVDGYIPVSSAAEFNAIRTGASETMGAGTCWAGTYTTGGDKKYIQVTPIDFTSFGTWTTSITVSSGFIYDGNELLINNISSTNKLFDGVALEINNTRFDSCSLSTILSGVGLIYAGTGLVSFNLQAESITVVSTAGGGDSNVGGLFGLVTGVVSVDGVYFDGSVTAQRNGVGGVFGFVNASSGSINNVSNSLATTVTCVNTPGNGIVGGLAGIIRGCAASNCTNNANITGSVRTGGCFGDFGNGALDIATSCVNNGNIVGLGGNVGGISGQAITIGSFHLCENLGSVTNNTGLNTGGICGIMVAGAEILRCVNSGNVTALSTALNSHLGGIVGSGSTGSNSSDVTECYVFGCTISGGQRTGGVVGLTFGTDITNCRVGDDVIVRDASQWTAGLCGGVGGGSSNNLIQNSYSAASIPSGTGQRGLVGGVFSGTNTTNNSYWDTTVGPATSSRGTGQTTTALQTPTSNTGIYSAWTIPPWDFGTSSEYPTLTTTP